MDGKCLCAHLRGAVDAGIGVRRSLRTPAHLHCRACAVHPGLRCLRARTDHRPVDLGARSARCGCRRRDAAGAGADQRRLCAGAARLGAGHLFECYGTFDRHRPRRRRCCDLWPGVAMGVLAQSAVRPCRHWCQPPAPAGNFRAEKRNRFRRRFADHGRGVSASSGVWCAATAWVGPPTPRRTVWS